MFPFVDIFVMIVKSIVSVIINPLFWVVLFLVHSQYRKSCMLEERMLGIQKYSVWDRLASSVLAGLAGGFIGSMVMVLVGVTLGNAGILYVWVIAILLMMVNPRYMCFSYAGGIVSLCSLVFGFPRVDVPSLMAIVAILHLVESVLIYFNGHKHSVPVYMHDRRYGVVGGFSLMRFWPIPIVIMTVITGQVLPGDAVPMPDWWPLIRSMEMLEAADPENLTYIMLPVVAALGYSDVAITHTPEAKSLKSALSLSGYSIVLLVISVIASYYRPFQWLAAFFGPVFHELLIIRSKSVQKRSKPLYIPVEDGVRVLDVLPDSVSEKMGIKRGDIIYRINGKRVLREESITDILSIYPAYIWVDVLSLDGNRYTREYRQYPSGIGSLGVMVVPREGNVDYMTTEFISPLKRLLNRFETRKRRNR